MEKKYIDNRGWKCMNGDSEYCTDFTDYEHTCPDWKGRGEA